MTSIWFDSNIVKSIVPIEDRLHSLVLGERRGKIYSYLRQRCACEYEFSWRSNPASIIFRIHTDILMKLPPIKPEPRFGMREEFKADWKKDFGYDGCLKNLGEENGFMSFSFLPDFSQETHLYHVPMTFETIQEFIKGFEGKTSANFSQLLEIDFFDGRFEGYGNQTAAEFLEIMKSNNDIVTRELPSVTAAMLYAWNSMLKLDPSEEQKRIRAGVSDKGSLYLPCSGPFSAYAASQKERNGFSICSDASTPCQQLTLLTGLAAFNDLTRKEMR